MTYLCCCCKLSYRHDDSVVEESPDSIEQRTGEEPGVPHQAGQQKVPQKITAMPNL